MPKNFRETGKFEGILQLQECGKGHQATLRLQVDVLPLVGEVAGSRLFVKVISARGLRAADKGGKSDPYCVVTIPNKPLSRFQTKYIRQTLQPEWQEESEIVDYVSGDDLLFEVWDHDSGRKDDFLGRKKLAASFFEVQKSYRGVLSLEEAGQGISATLMVHIELI